MPSASIIPGPKEQAGIPVLPTKKMQVEGQNKFSGPIEFWGTHAIENTKDYLYELAIGRPWKHTKQALSMNYLKEKTGELKGTGGRPAQPPARPGGTYSIIDSIRDNTSKYKSKRFDIDIDEVIERAYADMERDVSSRKNLEYGSFSDALVNAYEDGRGWIKMRNDLQYTADGLITLAHEDHGHSNGEPYGIDYRKAVSRIKSTARNMGSKAPDNAIEYAFRSRTSSRVARSLPKAA